MLHLEASLRSPSPPSAASIRAHTRLYLSRLFVQTLLPRYLIGLSCGQSIFGLWRHIKSLNTSTSACVHLLSPDVMTIDITALPLQSDWARRYSLFCLGLYNCDSVS